MSEGDRNQKATRRNQQKNDNHIAGKNDQERVSESRKISSYKRAQETNESKNEVEQIVSQLQLKQNQEEHRIKKIFLIYLNPQVIATRLSER